MEFIDIVKERYATKEFDGREIPEEKLNELLEMIRLSPSSFGIQPWKIVVISNKELKEKLSPVSWNQPQITTCSHLLVFCANTNILENIEKLEKEMIKNGAKPDDIKGYIDMMRGFEEGLGDERKVSWAQRQTYIALGNAVNGAKSLGFDSCPMEGFSPQDYSKILELPENIVPSALCAVGYATDSEKNKHQKIRFSSEEIFDFRN